MNKAAKWSLTQTRVAAIVLAHQVLLQGGRVLVLTNPPLMSRQCILTFGEWCLRCRSSYKALRVWILPVFCVHSFPNCALVLVCLRLLLTPENSNKHLDKVLPSSLTTCPLSFSSFFLFFASCFLLSSVSFRPLVVLPFCCLNDDFRVSDLITTQM